MRARFILISWLALVAGAWSTAHAAQAQGRTYFVIDSTADMAGLFSGNSKQQALSAALASVWPKHERTMLFGHAFYGRGVAGKAGCSDTSHIRDFSPISGGAAGKILDGSKTKGDTGVAYALETASARDDIRDPSASVVLIAGGPDICGGDPCAAAAKFAGDGGVPIHVIALDGGGEAESLQSLRCVAEITKGKFWQVSSAMELAAALDDALAVATKRAGLAPGANLRPGSADASGVEVAAVPAPPAEGFDPAKGPPGQITLTALMVEGGQPVTAGLVWRVFAAAGGSLKQVLSSEEANPTLTLPSGDYLVNVAYGRSYATRQVKVAEGTASEQFVINGGGLKLAAKLSDGTPAPVQFVTADIFSDERDQSGNRTKLISGVKPGVVIRLNSGLYRLAATYGDANATVQSDVAIEAGRITDATVAFSVARVTFRLVQQKGGEALTGTAWTIHSGDTSNVVKQSLAALPTHILAPGDYSVTAERAGKPHTQDFTVKAGDVLQVEVLAKE